jgi:hypothetical protein
VTNLKGSLIPFPWGTLRRDARERNTCLTKPGSASVLVPLYAMALFASALSILCLIGSGEISAAIPTALLISLSALPPLVALSTSARDLFSPFQFVAGYFLVHYGARSAYLQLNPRAQRLGLLAYDDYLPTATWLAILTFCSFALGYALAQSPNPAKLLHRICPRLPRQAPIFRFILLAALGVLAHAYILSYGAVLGQTYTQTGMREMLESPIPGWLPPLSGLVEIVFCLTTLYAISNDVPARNRRICKGIAWLCFVLIIGKTISQGIREYILLALALWVLCYHYKRRRVGLGTITSVLVCGALIFPTVQALREPVILKSAGGTPRSIGDISELVKASREYFGSLSAEDFAVFAMASILDRSQGVDALSLVVKYTPERAPWGLGSSYAAIPMQLFVPRALWADKPIQKAHQDFERTYMSINFFAQASPHMFSDFYRNFAVAGPIVGAFGIGVGFKYFYLVLLYSPWRKEILFIYAYIILNAIHEFESDFVAGTVIMVRAIIMVVFTLLFLSFGQGQADHSEATV